MNPETISSFISQVGFPIASYCALFWYIVKENRENRQVIQNNTIILNKILAKIDTEVEDGESK